MIQVHKMDVRYNCWNSACNFWTYHHQPMSDPKGRINIRVYIWGRFYRRRRDKMTRTWFAQTFFISSVSVAPCYPLVCENPFKYKHKCKQIDHWFKQITFIFTIFGSILPSVNTFSCKLDCTYLNIKTKFWIEKSNDSNKTTKQQNQKGKANYDVLVNKESKY